MSCLILCSHCLGDSQTADKRVETCRKWGMHWGWKSDLCVAKSKGLVYWPHVGAEGRDRPLIKYNAFTVWMCAHRAECVGERKWNVKWKEKKSAAPGPCYHSLCKEKNSSASAGNWTRNMGLSLPPNRILQKTGNWTRNMGLSLPPNHTLQKTGNWTRNMGLSLPPNHTPETRI